MKNFMNSKAIVSAIIIDSLVISTLIAGKYIIDFIDGDAQGADIGGGLVILLLPIITCIIIGIYRGKRKSGFQKETWLWCYILIIALEIIVMIIAAIFLKGDDIFLITTLSVPFDTFLFILYYGAGYIAERQCNKEHKTYHIENSVQ